MHAGDSPRAGFAVVEKEGREGGWRIYLLRTHIHIYIQKQGRKRQKDVRRNRRRKREAIKKVKNDRQAPTR